MLSTNFKIGTDAGITWHSLRNAVKMHNTLLYDLNYGLL